MTHIPAGLTVAVLDYPEGAEGGAIDATRDALAQLGAIAFATADPAEALAADGLVVAGRGPATAAVKSLASVMGERIVGQRLAGARPVLATGTGMQVLFERLDAKSKGFGEWPGGVEKLDAQLESAHVSPAPDSELLHGVDPAAEFDFHAGAGVREFALDEDDFIAYPRLSWVQEPHVLAAVENGALWATQFHPETSGEAGAAVLGNWLRQLG